MGLRVHSSEDVPTPKRVKSAPLASSSNNVKPSVQWKEKVGFTPCHLVSEWLQPGTAGKCIHMALLLPSGVSPADVSPRLQYGGPVPEIHLKWPRSVFNTYLPLKKWLKSSVAARKIENNYPKYLGFERASRGMRETLADEVTSKSFITLPQPVQKHVFEIHKIGFVEDGSRIVFLEFKARE